MKQVIKANDLVYVPSITPNLVRAHNFLGQLTITIGDTNYVINEQGQQYDIETTSFNSQPFAFLATPDTQERLAAVYGNLEGAPVDKELNRFELLLGVLIEEVYGGVARGVIINDVEEIKEKLVEMFKHRGTKE